jgi:hypothetical protein
VKKTLRTALGAAVVAGAVLLCCYVSALWLLRFEINRASQLFQEIHDVKIGDSAESVKPLVERYGGYRWNAQLGAHEDYNYVFVVNPWCFPSIPRGETCAKLHAIELNLNPRIRKAAGFRLWFMGGEISIKDDRVIAVQSETIVEGADIWLGNMWRSSNKPREFERSAGSIDASPEPHYFATPGILEMGTGPGTSWEFWTKSSSPDIQTRIAHSVNFECLHPFSTCETPCDLMPEAAHSFGVHPELAPRGGGWDENLRSCTKQNAAGTP